MSGLCCEFVTSALSVSSALWVARRAAALACAPLMTAAGQFVADHLRQVIIFLYLLYFLFEFLKPISILAFFYGN